MKTKFAVIAAACAGALAACGPSGGAASGGAVAGDTTVASFTGDWEVNAHIVAPWFVGPGFDPEADAEILGNTLTISDTGATGAAALTCAGATLAVAQQPLATMFDGKVTDAYVARAALGVEGEQTPALTGCNALTYYMIGDKKMLLAVGDVIYQFGPPSADEPSAPGTAAPAAPAEAPKPQ